MSRIPSINIIYVAKQSPKQGNMRACFSLFSKAFAVVFCSHVSSMLCNGGLSFKGGGGGVWKSFT